MQLIQKLKRLDAVTKVGVILIFMMLIYVGLLFLLKPVFISSDALRVHTTVMGDHIMTFTSPEQRNLNLAALFLAFVCGLAVWLLIKGPSPEKTETPSSQENKLEVSKQACHLMRKRFLLRLRKLEKLLKILCVLD